VGRLAEDAGTADGEETERVLSLTLDSIDP
jgi:hypothetical protein